MFEFIGTPVMADEYSLASGYDSPGLSQMNGYMLANNYPSGIPV
jgi:hypothetical protein